VPFLLSRPLNDDYRAIVESRKLRNFDIFDAALNGAVS
jgi:phosphonoacetate hydrolase